MQCLRIIPFVRHISHTHVIADDTNHEIEMSILRTYFPIMDSFRQMQNMDLGNINLHTFLKPQTEAKTQKTVLEVQNKLRIATSY